MPKHKTHPMLMTMPALALLIGSVVMGAVTWVAVGLRAGRIEAVTKPATMLLLIAWFSWQLAEAGWGVRLLEMRPERATPVHRSDRLAELVCSNSLRGDAPTNAVEPCHLKPAQQMALFPAASPLLDELAALDVTTMTPLEAINKLYEWQRKYGGKS